ncbi:MAG TPA: cupin domain-containing protein [Gammaproteobacteria bacterium]|nr:cupin domain-containing protein [Gammaproteobacteria bacterium]
MSFYAKPIACITIVAMSGLAFPIANADQVTTSKSTTKIPLSGMPATSVGSLAPATIFTPDRIEWKTGSDLFPVGSKVAILEGDPSKEGPFTMRVKYPANYRVAPHTHPVLEHMTVISGTHNLGIGQKFDSTKGTALTAGSFVVIPPELSHYGWGSEETILQIEGIGPRKKAFANATDNASNKPTTAVESTATKPASD